MQEKQKTLQELYAQKHKIENEIKRLEKALQNNNQNLTNNLSKDEKIELFKALFVGRFDIYLKHWISKDRQKQSFYKVTKTFGQDDYVPLDNRAIEEHLRGNSFLATYPINKYSKAKYLVIKPTFQDIAKLNQTLKEYGVCGYLQNNSSGDFCVWIFFVEDIESKTVKQFGQFILKSANISGEILPFEDFVNASKLGKYIELPLHLKHREEQKSIFFDIDTLKPVQDQWGHLQSVQRFDMQSVMKILNSQPTSPKNMMFDNIEFPKSIKYYLSDGIHIDTSELSSSFLNLLKSFATFENPQVQLLLSLRKPLYNTPKYIYSYEESLNSIKLPRGVFERFLELLKEQNIEQIFEDRRVFEKHTFPQIAFTLRDEQQNAIENLTKKDFCICVAPPGFGKTLIGATMISLRGAKTLVVVHKNMLLEQWIDRFVTYYNYDKKQIGYLGKGKNKLNGVLDIATMQSLKNSPEIIKNYSFVIVDECHHIPAVTFEQIIKQFTGRYILGLSATPNRKDGFEPILFQQLGNIAFAHKTKSTKQNQLIVVKTNFTSESQNYATLINELILDTQRNLQIVEEILKNQDRTILVLTDRIEHIDELHKLLKQKNCDSLVIHGSLNKKEQSENILKVKEEKIILATTSFFGEGIDFPHLNCIIFATPISYFGRVVQYLGRVGRDGQSCLAIDLWDYKNGMLNSTYKKRYEGYKQMNYKISRIAQ